MSRTIRRDWKIEGVPTDVTSARLSAPDGSYGVIRNDTGATIVADGTAMTRIAPGVYEYTFEEPAVGLAYTGYVEFISGGQVYHFQHDLPAVATSEVYGSYQYLSKEVAVYMGYGRGTLDAERAAKVESNVQRGVQRFYTPPPLPGEKYAHEWSFLRPVLTLATTVGTALYDLPADFSDLESHLTFAPGESTLYKPVEVVPEHEIRWRLSMQALSGRPEFAAYRPKPADSGVGTRYELLLYPVPNAIFTLSYVCRLSPGPLTVSNNMPYGGSPHYQTILQSCLAVAEESLDGVNGLHAAKYLERLQASVSRDRRLASSPCLGYNRDPSDAPLDEVWHPGTNIVTYRGRVS